MSDTSYVRWHLKKLARKSLAVTSTASAAATPGRGDHAEGVRVLTYHRFGNSRRDPFCVRTEDFACQMELLARLQIAVSLRDVEGFLGGRGALVDGAILVTIDDGCPSMYANALPILQRYRIPAVAFIPAGELTTNGSSPGTAEDEDPEARMSWHDLDAMVRAGVTVGSHGWTHASLARMPLETAREHAIRSREAIERHTGQVVSAFAYPFGTRADYNEATGDVLRDAGYACAFTSRHGTVRSGAGPFDLPRVKVEGGEALWLFRMLIRGGLDGWEWVDRVLWRLQAAGA